MKHLLAIVLAVVIIFGCCVSAFPMAAEYHREEVVQNQNWPAKLVELLTSQEWVYAYWCNAADYFYYKGDTRQFQKFLLRFSQIQGAELTLTIRSGPGKTANMSGGVAVYDWAVTGFGWGSFQSGSFFALIPQNMQPAISLELWKDGRVDFSKVDVPSNVRVVNGGCASTAPAKQSENVVKVRSKKPEVKDTVRQQVSAMPLKELNEAKLGQIAMYVRSVCGDKSRLLISEGSSANPQAGFASRSADIGDIPFITAYRLNSPCTNTSQDTSAGTAYIELRMILIGAVTIMAEATSPLDANSNQLGLIRHAPRGVYLLAYIGHAWDTEKETGTVRLFSVSADGEGNPKLQQVLDVPAVRHTRPDDVIYGGEDWYGVSVRFPKKEQVSENNPITRATVLMALNEPDGRYRSYEFQLDMQIPIE